MKTILLTLGDAAGIGPEVLVKCLSGIGINGRLPLPADTRILVIGELEILRDTAAALNLPVRFNAENEASENEIAVRSLGLLHPDDIEVGQLSALCGNAAYHYFAHAIEECLAGKAHAIVTAPLNKEAMNMAGHRFMGHTDILFKYGEEKYARSISKAIVNYRGKKCIESTLELADIVKGAVPAKYRREKHPARKSFQALLFST